MKKLIAFIIGIIVIIALASTVYFIKKDDNELVDVNKIKTDRHFENVIYNEIKETWDEDALGILSIEKIGLKATVKEGSDSNILSDYIGHIEETAIYDGNIGLAGHNRGNKYSYFARLNELKEGDIVTYKTKFYERNYKVDKIVVILETDWSLLQNTEENKITMITCIANKSNQRLCVQATEIK